MFGREEGKGGLCLEGKETKGTEAVTYWDIGRESGKLRRRRDITGSLLMCDLGFFRDLSFSMLA